MKCWPVLCLIHDNVVSTGAYLEVVSVVRVIFWTTVGQKLKLCSGDTDLQLRLDVRGGSSVLSGRFLAGMSKILWIWVHGACVSVSRCGLLPMHTHSEGTDSPSAAGAHRQAHLCCRWVDKTNCQTASQISWGWGRGSTFQGLTLSDL